MVGVMLCTMYSFYQLSVFTYGTKDLTPQQIKDLMWRESWDFLIHVKVWSRKICFKLFMFHMSVKINDPIWKDFNLIKIRSLQLFPLFFVTFFFWDLTSPHKESGLGDYSWQRWCATSCTEYTSLIILKCQTVKNTFLFI